MTSPLRTPTVSIRKMFNYPLPYSIGTVRAKNYENSSTIFEIYEKSGLFFIWTRRNINVQWQRRYAISSNTDCFNARDLQRLDSSFMNNLAKLPLLLLMLLLLMMMIKMTGCSSWVSVLMTPIQATCQRRRKPDVESSSGVEAVENQRSIDFARSYRVTRDA